MFVQLEILKNFHLGEIDMFVLTPNMPLIQLWCAQSKLNMDDICSLNICMICRYTTKSFIEIPPCAKKVIFFGLKVVFNYPDNEYVTMYNHILIKDDHNWSFVSFM